MPEQKLRDPETVSREARSDLRELVASLDRADVPESIVESVEAFKDEFDHIVEDPAFGGER